VDELVAARMEEILEEPKQVPHEMAGVAGERHETSE
jgi:hypothetical protein